MNKAPKIGQRVSYLHVLGKGESWEQIRTATGTVIKIWPEYNDVFNDEGEFIRRGSLAPEKDWHASVRVDKRPNWWPYPNTNVFAPCVAELSPIR